MKVVIIGKGLMLANIVLGVKDAGAEIVGVLRYEQTVQNPLLLFSKDVFNPEPEVTLLKQLKIPQLRFRSVNSDSFRKFLIAKNVDLLIVGTWKEKISKETFNIPKIATVNVHPSLLPQYRGPNPYMQVLLHGEKYTGVTLHLVDENYDSGAILSQEKIEVFEDDTSKELRERSVAVARSLVCNLVSDLYEKMITPLKQSEKLASYFPNISGDEKMLDFELQSSIEVCRTVRALHPFLPTYIAYKDKFFVVDPYSIQPLNDKVDANPGDIISTNADILSLTVVCKDKIPVRFSNLRLYKFPLITGIYIDDYVEVTSLQ